MAVVDITPALTQFEYTPSGDTEKSYLKEMAPMIPFFQNLAAQNSNPFTLYQEILSQKTYDSKKNALLTHYFEALYAYGDYVFKAAIKQTSGIGADDILPATISIVKYGVQQAPSMTLETLNALAVHFNIFITKMKKNGDSNLYYGTNLYLAIQGLVNSLNEAKHTEELQTALKKVPSKKDATKEAVLTSFVGYCDPIKLCETQSHMCVKKIRMLKIQVSMCKYMFHLGQELKIFKPMLIPLGYTQNEEYQHTEYVAQEVVKFFSDTNNQKNLRVQKILSENQIPTLISKYRALSLLLSQLNEAIDEIADLSKLRDFKDQLLLAEPLLSQQRNPGLFQPHYTQGKIMLSEIIPLLNSLFSEKREQASLTKSDSTFIGYPHQS